MDCGQPFLTQKVCQLVAQEGKAAPRLDSFAQSLVESVVQAQIIHHWESQDEPEHLKTIRDRLLQDERASSRLLGLYQQALSIDNRKQRQNNQRIAGSGITIDDSLIQRQLLLTGIVVKQQGYLSVRNPIYATVFDQA